MPLLGTDMATESLGNLTDQGARAGTWLLSVVAVPQDASTADASTADAAEHADSLFQISHCRVLDLKMERICLPIRDTDFGPMHFLSIGQDRWNC